MKRLIAAAVLGPKERLPPFLKGWGIPAEKAVAEEPALGLAPALAPGVAPPPPPPPPAAGDASLLSSSVLEAPTSADVTIGGEDLLLPPFFPFSFPSPSFPLIPSSCPTAGSDSGLASPLPPPPPLSLSHSTIALSMSFSSCNSLTRPSIVANSEAMLLTSRMPCSASASLSCSTDSGPKCFPPDPPILLLPAAASEAAAGLAAVGALQWMLEPRATSTPSSAPPLLPVLSAVDPASTGSPPTI